MKIETIDEFVKVAAVFKTGEDIRPAWFVWGNRKYVVKEVNYFWVERSGRDKLFCFSVTDGANTYELSFNADRAVWKLQKVCQEG